MRDTHDRHVDYLRVSITDRCNERCSYCMPADHSDWLPRESVLSYEEIERTIRVATTLGFTRFRITGGEPLVRRDAAEFIERVGRIEGIQRLAMTTNATRLAPVAKRLRRAGLRDLNISLDALDPDVYAGITRGRLNDALAGIDAALDAGFDRVKLNVVLLRGLNEDQLYPICEYAAARGVDAVRFIELMPVSLAEMTDETGADRYLSSADARRVIETHDALDSVDHGRPLGDGPAKYARLRKLGLTVGFIGAMSDDHFCETCNKVRLTADGFIRPCLGNHGEVDLKPALRDTPPADVDAAIAATFARALAEKPADHTFRDRYTPLRIMTAIGG